MPSNKHIYKRYLRLYLILYRNAPKWFFDWTNPCLYFFIFDFSIQFLIQVILHEFDIGFEPRVYGVRSNHSTNWVTTTALRHQNVNVLWTGKHILPPDFVLALLKGNLIEETLKWVERVGTCLPPIFHHNSEIIDVIA